MKKKSIISRIIAAALLICFLFTGHGMSILSNAAEKDQELKTQYVKDVKLFYGETSEDAKKLCEEEGYTFCPENLKEKSNTDLAAHLGYKTTKNKGNAITDITLLDMKNSHWNEQKYSEFLDQNLNQFADGAAQMMILVNEFRSKYAAGSPNALEAYDSLNMFYIDENQSHKDTANLLGRYLLEEADVAFFEKYMQRGNSQILSAIVNQLSHAASDYNEDGSTWIDKSKESDVLDQYREADSAEIAQFDTWYQDPAIRLTEELQTFADTYEKAKSLYDKHGETFGYEQTNDFDEDTTLDEMMEKDPDCRIPEYMNAMLTYDLFDQTSYDEDRTVAEYFVELGKDGNLGDHPESVYPIIASMSAAQRAVIDLSGLTALAKGLYQNEDYGKERKDFNKQAQDNLIDRGYEDGKIWLWEGVDQSIWNKKVAKTSDAIEAENAGTELINSINAAAREASSDLTIALQITDIALLGLSGIGMIIQACVGTSLWAVGTTAFWAAGTNMAFGFTAAAIGYGLLGALMCSLFILNIVVLVASLIYMVYSILDMCGVFDDPELAEYDKMPDVLFHVRKNQNGNYYVRYEAVPSNGMEITLAELLGGHTGQVQDKIAEIEKLKKTGEYKELIAGATAIFGRLDLADVGAFQGVEDRWMTLYATKAPACGDPIEVVPGESIIKTQFEDYQSPGTGCRPVTLIGGKEAADINSIKISGKTGTPLYMFYIKDPETADEKPKEASTETSEAGQYISRVRLAHYDNRKDAINSLKKSGFTDIIDVNLTPYDGHTYIGYQLGSREGALTDLRVSSMPTDPIMYGTASYGRMGTAENGMTPDGVSLYGTTDPNAGTPITKITVETERLKLGSGAEPVCLFSGGNAVDFKHKWSDNVYFDETKYKPEWPWQENHHVETKQDDPKQGLYIYFWPETQYKAESEDSKPPYVSGFSYFLAASDNTKDNRYGTHAEYMQNFAKENGFELVMDGDAPKKMMSEKAGQMNPIGSWQDKEGGALGHDWTYDMYHYMNYGAVSNFSDGGVDFYSSLGDMVEDEYQMTTMYFGVSYTYNPYRAITGVSGMITPYTETTHSLRFSGLQTPAGTMQTTNVSIQGNPVTQAGICWGYFSYTSMPTSLYPYRFNRQKYNIPWLSGGTTEVLTHHLLSAGPAEGREPFRREDLKFVCKANPGQHEGYVPVCDMRTPGDYNYPMNLALDTTENGSEYMYLYISNSAGGRKDNSDGNHNVYQKKHYVAAVFCGTGKTPEEAMNSLYGKAASAWSGLAQRFPDLPKNPLITEMDEVIPYDLCDEQEWYKLYARDVKHRDPSNDEWVRGNDAANLRWGHRKFQDVDWWKLNQSYGSEHMPDGKETMRDYAYIGVVRTNYEKGTAMVTEKDEKTGEEKTTKQTVYPAYGLLKYYSDATSAPGELMVASVKCTLAGGPIKSKEGQYYLYYSPNTATAAFSAPITEIDFSDEAFINGYNTTFSCKESDRVNNALPSFSSLRMRTDEYKYIHTKYDMQDLPYIEQLYIGVGNNKKEAYADLIGTTNANGASNVNCNYNAYTNQWIAIGYRRTASPKSALHDVFLYSGDNPPDSVSIPGYICTTTKSKGKEVTNCTEGEVTYKLLKHTIKSGAEVMSLNRGAGGTGLYLYYSSKTEFGTDLDAAKQITPIRNISFAYGDISPGNASAEDLAIVYGGTLHGMKIFDTEAYRNPNWENVLGVTTSPKDYQIDGSVGKPMSLNYGQLPMVGNEERHAGDQRVMMYVDHADITTGTAKGTKYSIRPNAALSKSGYYSATSKTGILMQK